LPEVERTRIFVKQIEILEFHIGLGQGVFQRARQFVGNMAENEERFGHGKNPWKYTLLEV
jgi:hypothetical protein